MTSPHLIGPGTELDGFLIEAIAGRGGMGVVYRARQHQPDRIVALKVIADDLADDPEFAARFKREAMLAAQIEHPNVIPIYAVGESDGVFYIAMRFIEGVDLRALLSEEGRLAPARAAMLVDQVAQALDAAHSRGLVHRDVKPANILVSTAHGREHVYLSDFGLSRHVHGTTRGLTATGAFLGTIDYIAPEQARGEAVDGRTDVYSLGCVLFQALTGTVPYPLDNDVAKLYAHDAQPPPSVQERAPDVPLAFEGVLARAMAKAPGDRYASAGDLGRAAVAAAAGDVLAPGAAIAPSARSDEQAPPSTPTAAASTPPAHDRQPATPGTRSRRAVIIGGLLAAGLAAAAVAAIVLGTGGSTPSAAGSRNLVVVRVASVRAPGRVTYRLVLSTVRPRASTPPGRREPYYLALWVRRGAGPLVRVERLKLPWRFTATSTITQLALDPNSDGSGNVGLSWLIGGGDTTGVTHYLTVTPSGITIDS